MRDGVSEEVPASKSPIHQGNATEERALEKLTFKNVKSGGAKQETKIEIRPVEQCLAAGGTACRGRLLDWSKFPHAYFYGNWRAKVPIILQGQGI